jgi:hypothetical protein
MDWPLSSAVIDKAKATEIQRSIRINNSPWGKYMRGYGIVKNFINKKRLAA